MGIRWSEPRFIISDPTRQHYIQPRARKLPACLTPRNPSNRYQKCLFKKNGNEWLVWRCDNHPQDWIAYCDYGQFEPMTILRLDRFCRKDEANYQWKIVVMAYARTPSSCEEQPDWIPFDSESLYLDASFTTNRIFKILLQNNACGALRRTPADQLSRLPPLTFVDWPPTDEQARSECCWYLECVGSCPSASEVTAICLAGAMTVTGLTVGAAAATIPQSSLNAYESLY